MDLNLNMMLLIQTIHLKGLIKMINQSKPTAMVLHMEMLMEHLIIIQLEIIMIMLNSQITILHPIFKMEVKNGFHHKVM